MRKLAGWMFFLAPCLLLAQGNTSLGISISPLILNTLDVQLERQVTPNFSLQLNTGFRLQSRDRNDPTRFSFLNDFVHIRNRAAFLSLGGRLYYQTDWDFPYITFHLVSNYFHDRVVPTDAPPGSLLTRDVRAFKFGGAVTFGFVIRLAERWNLDLGIQMGYSKARSKQDVLAYYLPGLGYSTFGLGRFGVDGGHFQPILTLKYHILQDKRERIRDME